MQSKDDFSGSSMSDKQLMDECLTFLVAGHETVALLLTWTMYLLAAHPQWQDKARAEVMEVCKDSSATGIQYENLNMLPNLSMILSETLRLYPASAAIGRECIQANKLGDIEVPVGVDISIPVAFLHRKKELWGEDAHCFAPERFAKGLAGACSHPLAFLPFGGGPRTCIGQAFALTVRAQHTDAWNCLELLSSRHASVALALVVAYKQVEVDVLHSFQIQTLSSFLSLLSADQTSLVLAHNRR